MFSNCNKKYVHKTLRIRTFCRDVEKKKPWIETEALGRELNDDGIKKKWNKLLHVYFDVVGSLKIRNTVQDFLRVFI